MPRNTNRKKKSGTKFGDEEEKGIRMDNRYGGGREDFNESDEEKEEEKFLEEDDEDNVDDLIGVKYLFKNKVFFKEYQYFFIY